MRRSAECAGLDAPPFGTLAWMSHTDDRATNDVRMPPLPAAEIRARFLEYFAERGHTVVPSASLVPAGDQTLLFTNSGMVQFKDVFRGVEQRSYTRAVDVQRCLRVAGKHNDFEEVGRTPRHHTLFEMLGNWSFGDYFKRDAIHWAWDFLTRDLAIPAERLAATTYTDDEEAWAIWRDEIGLPPERMARWGDVDHGDDENFWRMAETGPAVRAARSTTTVVRTCPRARSACPITASTARAGWRSGTWCSWSSTSGPGGRGPRCRSRAWIPAWASSASPRWSRVSRTNYDTDLFTPILRPACCSCWATTRMPSNRSASATRSSPTTPGPSRSSSRTACCRPTRGAAMCCGASSAARCAMAGCWVAGTPFLVETATVVIDSMGDAYPILRERRTEVLGAILREETAFARTLDAGTVHLEEALIPLTGAERVIGRLADTLPADAPVLSGDVAFRLHDTYGFPIDLTVELAGEYGVRVDRPGFDAALEEQRQRSRSGRKADLSRQAGATALYDGIARSTGDTRFLGYDGHHGGGSGRGHRPGRHELPGAGGASGGRAAGRRRCGRGAGARPDAVLRRARRPGGRYRPDP